MLYLYWKKSSVPIVKTKKNAAHEELNKRSSVPILQFEKEKYFIYIYNEGHKGLNVSCLISQRKTCTWRSDQYKNNI